ncbi:MAG TPA: hypothetical protein VGU20_24145 [Stellaceae bacterium]|nr:hypothetical protein [Stellaceae bacterium]
MELDLDFRAGSPIWQGDLLGFEDWTRAHPLEKYGVIITADCDIQRARPEQELVFLRVITQADYIDVVWSRSKLERARDKLVHDTTQMVNRLRKAVDAEATALDETDVARWITTTNATDICDALLVSEERERARLIDNATRARTVVEQCKAPLRSACLEHLMRCRSQGRSDLLKQASNELAKLPDDIFFITGITEPGDETGYYILLDQIGAIRLNQITDSLAEVRQGSKRAYRFGRLSRVYKYSMAQRFAFLFQRIGLPDDHAVRHGQALHRLNQATISGMDGAR